jgi:hypothetical protein
VLENFLQSLYNKVFINIVVNRVSTTVYMELCAKKKIIESKEATFETQKINTLMLEFIRSYTRETPYFYISILDMSTDQGAIPTCDRNRLSYFHDLSASEYKCHDNSWTYYTSKSDLYNIEKTYSEMGIDFIFSPFSVITNFFKDKIKVHTAMYILIQEDYITISVFDNSKLLYADHIDVEIPPENDVLMESNVEDMELDLEDGIDLEEIDVDDINMIDDFGDIEDLDSIEEIDEFAEHRDLEEEFYKSEEKHSQQSETEDNFNEDYQRFSLIQNSLSHFYKDKKYESKFVETVYIADGVGVSSDLKRYLEEEMFLSVYIRHIDISMEVCELTKLEFNL